MITEEVARSIDSSVLCWLATVSEDGTPNVSPKEAFLHDGNGRILVAHIASPQTVRNIENNSRVCISFIDVFTQIGHKIKGTAKVLGESDSRYERQKSLLTALVGDTFRILSVIEVEPSEIEEIVAPSYRVIPGTTARKMVQQSLNTYRVVDYQKKAEETD